MSQNTIEEIEEAVDEALANADNPFAVFDFDNTCIVNDIGEATLAYICGHELLRDRSLLGEEDSSGGYHERVFHTYHSLVKEGRLKAAYMLNARMFSGFSQGEAEAATLTAIAEEGKKIGSKMLYDVHIERGLARRDVVLSLMEHLRKRGVHIWIVSASPEPCVRAAMQHFGIMGELIGVRSILRDGIFVSELEIPMPIIEGKVECMLAHIDASHAPILAIGDSMSDLPMLETAEIKVVVDRGNELSKIARERGWFLL